MSAEKFPVQRLASCVVVTLIVTLLSVLISSSASGSWVVVTFHGSIVSHVRDAFREELVHVHSCACVTQNELIGLAICDIGHADKEARVESGIVCLFDAVEDIVGFSYSLSKPSIVGL